MLSGSQLKHTNINLGSMCVYTHTHTHTHTTRKIFSALYILSKSFLHTES